MKLAIVCTHGGHLTETLQLMDAFKEHEIFFATHYSSRDQDVLALAPAYFIENIGARPVRLFMSFFWALKILRREKPEAIISLGAEIAIPFFVWGKLLHIRTIFIESWCRVFSLSKTGKLVYPLVDVFWVQWPQLLSACGPKAKFMGSVI